MSRIPATLRMSNLQRTVYDLIHDVHLRGRVEDVPFLRLHMSQALGLFFLSTFLGLEGKGDVSLSFPSSCEDIVY